MDCQFFVENALWHGDLKFVWLSMGKIGKLGLCWTFFFFGLQPNTNVALILEMD